MQGMQTANPAPALQASAIVTAGSSHIPAIQAIYATYVQTSVCTMEELAPSVAEMHRRHDALRREGLPWLVALDDDQVAGYAYAGRYRSRIGYIGTVETSIYVHPDYQGRGVGRRLLQALIQECRQVGLRQMVAVIVRDLNTIGSIRLHERHGFRHAGVFEQVGRKFGQNLDTVLMQRNLVDA
ncbi:MAG: GNAT family N-acetyltransferase [Xylophilus ampelinus]